MTLENRFEKALGSPEPLEKLRSLVLELSTEGSDKATILQIFEQQRQRLRAVNREAEEDIVMDIMDFLVGWCSPDMKLLLDETGDSTRAVQIQPTPIQESVL